MSLFRYLTIVVILLVGFLVYNYVFNIPSIISKDDLLKIDQRLINLTASNEFSGVVLISQDDSIIFQKAYGYSDLDNKTPNSLETQFYIGSLTKQFTAFLVVAYCLEYDISLDTKIGEILPAFSESKITIHHLLSHSSGIPHYEGLELVLPIYDNESRQKLFASKKHSIEEYTSLISQMGTIFPPGKRYKYSSFNYILLGAILERVSGKKYKQLLSEYITKPFQLGKTGFDYQKQIHGCAIGKILKDGRLIEGPFQDQTILFSTGGIHSNIADLYKWVKLFYHYEGLNEIERNLIFSNYSEIGFRHFYGYGVMKRDGFGKIASSIGFNQFDYFEHGGKLPGYRSAIISIEQNVDVIILCNIGNAINPREIIAQIYELL